MTQEPRPHHEYPHPADEQKIGIFLVAQPYALNWGRALLAGFLATIAITLMMYLLPPLMGMRPINIGTLLGTMLFPEGGPSALWAGMMWHFANGIVFTLIYAGVLLALRKQSTAGTGASFGVVLWFLAMVMMPVVVSMHPLARAGQISGPGVFLLRRGWMSAIFDLAAHLVYGVIAGVVYHHAPKPRG